MRRGLKGILSAESDVATVGEAGSAPELLGLVRGRSWDVVLLDIGLPGLSGIDALRQLKQERPQLPVLMLSVHAAGDYAVRTLRAGASGYLTKEAAPDELIRAVRTVASGRRYVTSEVAEQLAQHLAHPADRPAHETLTDREYQILRLLGSGQTVTEVARALALSVKTISTHRSHILRKLHLRSSADLIRYALQQGLTS